MKNQYRAARRIFGKDCPPTLLVIVDTEEEFDWNAPFSRQARSVRSIPCQDRAHEIYDVFGVKPTYVIDYCVADDETAADYLKTLRGSGRCVIGTHLHGWVNPPYEEDVSAKNSYQCNLPEDLERRKLTVLTDQIEAATGERPTIFKAGRYGIGAQTLKILKDLGYRMDCSFVPYTNYSSKFGPNFVGNPPYPFWLDGPSGLLEIPLSKGFSGFGATAGPAVQALYDQEWFWRLKVGGVLSKSRLLERSMLSPEGYSATEQIRLLKSQYASGERVFSMTYHSPSLDPGHTPYVQTAQDLQAFLETIRTVLTFFRDELGGRFLTLPELYDEAAAIERLRANS